MSLLGCIPLVGLLLYDFIQIGVNNDSGTSFVAHAAGMAVGFTLGTAKLRNTKVTKTEKVIRYTCGVTFILFAIPLFLIQFKTFEFSKVDIGNKILTPVYHAGGFVPTSEFIRGQRLRYYRRNWDAETLRYNRAMRRFLQNGKNWSWDNFNDAVNRLGNVAGLGLDYEELTGEWKFKKYV